MRFWFLSACLAVCGLLGPASAQQASVADDVREGHRLAVLVCAYCHMAAPDQTDKPLLQPPGPSFASIARRKDFSADFLRTFLATTHRDIGRPQGMPNPELLDSQVNQVAAYLLSLRAKP